MSQTYARRLDRLEDAVVIGADSRKLEKLKRYPCFILTSSATIFLQHRLKARVVAEGIPKWIEAL